MEANTFAGGTLDRVCALRRDDAWVQDRRADASTRTVVAGRDGVLVEDLDRPRPALLPGGLGEPPVLLGLQDGAARFAADLADVAPPPGTRVANLREVSASLAAPDAALLAYAAALLDWHRRTRFCGVCGAPTRVGEAGHLRVCTRDGTSHHPRTDPVIIVLVTEGADRALLGRQAVWATGRWSALAGFVEPGESLEEAVAREVDEEAGVAVAGVSYVSSQPWPFPANLMLGFHARWAGGEPTTRDAELEAVRWFTREQVAEAHAAPDRPWIPPAPDDDGSGFWLPPREAIARRLVAAWLRES